MYKNKIKKYQIISIFFTFVLGSLFHFTYKLSGNNPIIAIFSAVNESVWEHLKLVYFPMLLTIILGYFYLSKDIKNFICSKTIGILVSILFIVVAFYTYTGILGKNISFIDISLFFISTILGEYIGYLLMIKKVKCNVLISIIILILLFISFSVFTYYPPNIGLFKIPM